MAELALDHVSKHYTPGVAALDDLTLTVGDGELVVLVGPSGCGKTTTLRLIAGLETLTTGTIRINGRVVNDLPPRQRDVALGLSAADALSPSQCGGQPRLRRAHVPGRLELVLRPRLNERIRHTADLLDLTDCARAPASEAVRRTAAARRRWAGHWCAEPAVFLLDEPLSNLDPALRHEMRRELHLLQRRLRATMVYVTHDQVEAMTLGDRIVVLDRGRVQQVGRPLDLYERPANRFVAGFLGWPPMNFFDGSLLSAETFGLLNVYNGSDAIVGIRPEHVTIRETTVADPTAAMDVLLVEPLGSTTLITLGRNGRQLMARMEGRPTLSEGQTVEVRLDVKFLHLFDRHSGLALRRDVLTG